MDIQPDGEHPMNISMILQIQHVRISPVTGFRFITSRLNQDSTCRRDAAKVEMRLANSDNEHARVFGSPCPEEHLHD